MSEHKLVCRKCGGSHLTIKCGRLQNDKQNVSNQLPSKQIFENKKYNFHTDIKKNKIYGIKISNLPNNMTNEELMELTSNWGHIVRLKVLNYEETSCAYISFAFEDEAKYFVKALDKTPFEYQILNVVQTE